MPRQVLCYGDSNTWGCVPLEESDVAIRFSRADRWPGVLQDELGSDYWIIEEGLNGRTTSRDDEAEPYRNGLEFLLPTLETHYPLDLVIVMLGTNDLKGRFNASPADIAASAGELVDAVRDSPFGPSGDAPDVLLICPPPLGVLDGSPTTSKAPSRSRVSSSPSFAGPLTSADARSSMRGRSSRAATRTAFTSIARLTLRSERPPRRP